MRVFLAPLLLVLASCMVSAQHVMPSPWTWVCHPLANGDGRCVRTAYNSSMAEPVSLETCKLTCSKHAVLWPLPKTASLSKRVINFHPDQVTSVYSVSEEDDALLEEAVGIFIENLKLLHPECEDNRRVWETLDNSTGHSLKIIIQIARPSIGNLKLDAGLEQYDLTIETQGTNTTAKIIAPTYYGARHGLETLSQLVEFDQDNKMLQMVSSASIADFPAYPYRGVLLDTARNFIKVKAIERTIDGMAASKLNTLHWHITDSQAFPMVLKTLPKMSFYGAYSPRQMYHPKDIKHIVHYGKVRGVRVLPEFDAPAHVGYGWEWGPQENLGDLAVCVNRQPWYTYCLQPPCGQLNIANPNIYPILGKIYKEMIEMFGPLDLFHYGGDEVNIHCWNTTNEIVSYMKNLGSDLSADSYYDQWSLFQDKAQQEFTKANNGKENTGILWTSHLTEKGRTDKYLDKNKYIIQIWSEGNDPLIKELLEKQYKVIFSNSDSWYLDCGFGAYVGEGNNWCSPYKGWQKVYDNSPSKIALNMTGGTADLNLIQGGEVALWTEQVDSESVDGRIWPRAAALGERLWSNPEHNWEPAEFRMIHHRQRLVKRGIAAERLQPQFCHEYEGNCYPRVKKTSNNAE